VRLLKVLNFFVPSTHTSIREIVPVTVADASTETGEPTVEALTGLHMFTPGALGALQPEPVLMVYEASPTSLCEKPGASATA
jgi:hypothetical protein